MAWTCPNQYLLDGEKIFRRVYLLALSLMVRFFFEIGDISRFFFNVNRNDTDTVLFLFLLSFSSSVAVVFHEKIELK